jgi:hypothetical protein
MHSRHEPFPPWDHWFSAFMGDHPRQSLGCGRQAGYNCAQCPPRCSRRLFVCLHPLAVVASASRAWTSAFVYNGNQWALPPPNSFRALKTRGPIFGEPHVRSIEIGRRATGGFCSNTFQRLSNQRCVQEPGDFRVGPSRHARRHTILVAIAAIADMPSTSPRRRG